MIALRSLSSKPNSLSFDKAKLIGAEAYCRDCGDDAVSNYSSEQECVEFSDVEKTPSGGKEVTHSTTYGIGRIDVDYPGEFESVRGLCDPCREDKNSQNVSGTSWQDFDPLSMVEERITKYEWSLLLRCRRVLGINLVQNDKVWRPVLVKLENSVLRFYAADFESSPSFKVIHLTWSHAFRMPLKFHAHPNGFLFTTALLNTLQPRRKKQTMARSLSRWKIDGQKEAKISSANQKLLLDFIETVQKCISIFPSFRPQGIRYEKDRMLLLVKDIYRLTQSKRKFETVANKEVQIMVKANISATPECCLYLQQSQSFLHVTGMDDVVFHKCVRGTTFEKQIVTARFHPLDNCWFRLMHWRCSSLRPPPLYCDVTLTVDGEHSVELRALIFAASTRVEVTSASDLTLRFCIPSLLLKAGKLEDVFRGTTVSKGTIAYCRDVNTILWYIPKLRLQSGRNFYLAGKPLASLCAHLRRDCDVPAVLKIPVDMDFSTEGSARISEIGINKIKIGHKTFEHFKARYSSAYHIGIPIRLLEMPAEMNVSKEM